MGRRRLVGVGLALAALTAASAAFPSGQAALRPLHLAGPAKEPGPLLGIVWHHRSSWLARIDGATMRMVGRPAVRLSLAGAWSYSPDGSSLAIAARRFETDPETLRFVDREDLRPLGRPVPLGAQARSLAWLRPDRIVAIAYSCCSGEASLVRVDTAARRVVGRESFGESTVVHAARAGDSLILLLAPTGSIGTARLVVAGADGSRSVALDGVRAGSHWDESSNPPLGTQRVPGLAVDAAGARAFVITPERTVVEVDLRTLDVASHTLGRPSSLLARVAGWLQPTAEAKGMDGPERGAVWLGDGRLAVTGADWSVTVGGGKMRMSTRPAGLEIVDTTTWSSRTLDAGASAFTVADGLLLATGSSFTSDEGEAHASDGIGLSGYGPDGRKRFQVLGGSAAWVAQAYEGRAYVGLESERRLWVVDLGTGALTGRRDANVPMLLAGEPASF